MRAALLVVTALVLSVGSAAAPPTASALTSAEIACQDAILQGAQDFVSDKLKAIVDCNDKAGGCKTDKRDRQIMKATARLTRPLERICRGVTLENLGFPGTCPPGSGGSFSVDDLGSCLAVQLETFVDSAIALAYPSGSPPTFSGNQAQCQNVIGGESRVFINRKLRARGRCLDQQIKGNISSAVACLAPVPPGTGDHDADRLISQAIKSLKDKLRRGCDKTDLTTIGFPGLCPEASSEFTTSDLDACLETGLEMLADEIAAFLFPLTGPVSTPTPTIGLPTASPTPSGITPTGTAAAPTDTATTSTPTASATIGEPTATASPGGEPTATATTGEPTPTASSTPIVGETATIAEVTPTPVEATGTAAAETPTPTATSTPVGGGTCPTLITFTGTSTGGVLDSGWTGQGHDATTITDGTVTVSVTGCAGSAPNCNVCSYTGPIDNAPGQLKVHRCFGDSSITCTANGDCGANAPCVFYFGSNLPLAAGGVATCVTNSFSGGISGTANVTSGTGGQSAGTALLTSRVYSGPTLGEPCPRCVGDATANDGTKGGTCSAGLHSGALCDASGSSPNTEWGTTSLDCPPLTGGQIAALAIDLTNTTGTRSRTLSTANPLCSSGSFAADRCQCDTCNNGTAQVCATNADCPISGGNPGICGGKRCISGTNVGAPCANTTECPGSSCNTPGTKTQPNQCDGGDTDCAPGDNSPATSANDHICGTGPFEQFCGPTETFRGCTSNADCGFAGDTCSISRFRECFDTGHVGDVVSATGVVSAPAGHQSDPTLAALFCIGPTASGAVNGAAGLPGLGRLEIQGHSTDNGTP